MCDNINLGIPPPLQSKIQYLPFEYLEWDKFENLCLSIIQEELNISINDCERYGLEGQNQQGIDIFAKQTNGLYSTFQCKKYNAFRKGNLDDVIEKFEGGDFFNKSQRFYICTACDLKSNHIQDAFNKHWSELKSRGIELIKWDKIQLSRILKKHPQIVYDYFDRGYVIAFNGEEALSSIFCKSDKEIQSYLEIASSDLFNINNNFHIPDSHIKRKETEELYEWIKKDLEGKEPNIAIITGGAGIGKTVVLKDLLNLLYENKIPTLGLKADKKFLKEEDVNKSVFGEDVDIIKVFRRLVSKHRVAVLLIDQIDALSQSLSTNRAQINAYTSIINQLSRIGGVRVIISCRKFDLHYDQSLKQLTNKKIIEIVLLSDSEVETVLIKLTGKKLSYFPKDLVELLRTPLHLEVFCRIYTDSTIIHELKNLQDLYRNLWNQKVKEVKSKTDIEPSRLVSAIFYIAKEIYERQDNLCIPALLLENDYYNETKYLNTEGLTIEHKGSIQFFHQTFYDYCFAREFVERQEGYLYNYLINLSHQGLFIRSSVKQILSYLRVYSLNQYILELQQILFTDKVRFHIKQLIIDQLSFEENPCWDEFKIIIKLSEMNQVLASSFFNSIPNENWYEFFIKEQKTIINLINKLGTDIQKSAARFIVFSVNKKIEATYRLLQNVTDNQERFSLIDWALIRTLDFNKSIVLDSYKDIDQHYIKSNEQKIHILDMALKSNPDFAIKEAKCIFYKKKSEWTAIIRKRSDNKEYQHFDDFCEKLYNTHPQKAYIFFRDIVRELINNPHIENKYFVQTLEENTLFENHDPDMCKQHKLVECMIDYLKGCTIFEPDFVRKEVLSFISDNKVTEIHIALQVMAANVSVFIDEVYTVLLNSELVEDFLEINDLKYWYRDLLEKIVTHIDDERKGVLNNFLLSYYTEKDFLKNSSFYEERKKYGTLVNKIFPYPCLGYHQRLLLHSLPQEYIEDYPLLKKRLQELDRRFSGWVYENEKPNHRVSMASACGPLGSNVMYATLSIEQWFKSFQVYDKDINYSKRRFFDIGAHARAFKEVVKNDTDKFFEFVSRIIISNNVHIRYQINGLEGLIEGGYDMWINLRLYSVLMQYDITEMHIHSFVRMSKSFIKANVVNRELIDFLKEYSVRSLPDKQKSSQIFNQDDNRNDILFSEGFKSINAGAFDALVELSMLSDYVIEIYDFLLEIHPKLPIQLRLVVLCEINNGYRFSNDQLLNIFLAYTRDATAEVYHVAQGLINRLFIHSFKDLIQFIELTLEIPNAAESLGVLLLYGWFYENEESKRLLLKLHQLQPKSIEFTILEVFKHLNDSEFKDKCLFIINLYLHDERRYIREAYTHSLYQLTPDNFILVQDFINELIKEQDENDRLYDVYQYLIKCCNIYYIECIDMLKLINFEKSAYSMREIEEPIKLLTLSYNAIKEYDSSDPYMEFAMDVFDNLLQQFNYRTNIEDMLKKLDAR